MNCPLWRPSSPPHGGFGARYRRSRPEHSSGARNRIGGLLVVVAAALACRAEPSPSIELTVAGETTRFETRTAFAEYWELSGQADELRITLASYGASCERFVPPPDGEAVVTIQILIPEGKRLELGDFPWTGLEPQEETPRNPATAYALPFVRIPGRGFALAPGGAIRISEFEPRIHGKVEGLLSFQGIADDTTAATRLTGRFEAKLCRFSPLPAPPGAE